MSVCGTTLIAAGTYVLAKIHGIEAELVATKVIPSLIVITFSYYHI